MAYWRHTHWHKLAQLLLLLVVLGQTFLVLHESGHSNQSADNECQLCLHAQPHVTVAETASLPSIHFERLAVVGVQLTQPPYFSPVYSNTSRGPPRA